MGNDVKWKSAGEKLRALRKKSGLSIFKVARSIHISGSYLSLLERGVRAPSAVVINNIAEFYNIDKAELFALYNKVEPETLNEIVSNPSLRKLLSRLSTESKLSHEEIEELTLKIHKIYTELSDDSE